MYNSSRRYLAISCECCLYSSSAYLKHWMQLVNSDLMLTEAYLLMKWILLYIFFYDEAVWYCNLKHPVFLHKNTIAHYEFWFTSLTSIKWKLKHSLYYFLNIDTDEYSLWLLIRWVFLQNLRMMLLDCKLTHRVFVQIMILTNESSLNKI